MNYLLIIDIHQVSPETRRSIDVVVKSYNASWWHFIHNIWIIHDPDGTNYDRLLQAVETRVKEDDGWFMLITLNQANQIKGILPKEAWEWLQNNLERPVRQPPRVVSGA